MSMASLVSCSLLQPWLRVFPVGGSLNSGDYDTARYYEDNGRGSHERSGFIPGGSFGLGAGKLRTIFRIVLPAAMPGILAGIVLSVGRIVGETAALIYTAGSVAQIPANLLAQVGPFPSICMHYGQKAYLLSSPMLPR